VANKPRPIAIVVNIPDHLFTSPAYRALGLLCRYLLIELLAAAKRVGTDEPLNCSVRMAADMCGMGKSHAAEALDELEARGFIVSVRRGDRNGRGLGRGRASSWRITCLPFQGAWATCDYNRAYDREHNREIAEDRMGEPFITPEMEAALARRDRHLDDAEHAELTAQMDAETPHKPPNLVSGEADITTVRRGGRSGTNQQLHLGKK
jgi:hypothetical protein